MNSSDKTIPETVLKYFAIKLLGEAFREYCIEEGSIKIKHGYLYDGVKYYE